MQRAQTFLRRVSSVSAATVSRWMRFLLIPILAAALFSSLTDLTAPLSAVHAAPTSSSAHNAGNMKSHAPDLRDESAWFQLKHIGTNRPSANARALALTKAASLPHSRFGQASQVRSGGKNGTSAQTQVAAAGNAPAPNSGGWTPLGPAPEVTGQGVSDSGRITSIAVNPQNSNDIWIGSADGGVWNSLDGGTSWVPMTDGLTDYPVTQNGQTTEVIATLSIGSIAIDPTNPQVIYVGTGEANFNADGFWGVGLLKSTDHGQTWTQYGASQFTGLTIGKIIIDPTNSNTLLAAVSINATSSSSTEGTEGLPNDVSVSQAGIYRSTDGGQTWKQTLGSPMFSNLASATDVIFDPTDHNVVYAGFGQLGITGTNPTCPCLWESASNGALGSWTSVSSPALPSKDVSLSRVSLSISQDGSRFYALLISLNPSDTTKDDMYHNSIYVSDHTASSWMAVPVPSQIANDAGEDQWWYDTVLAADPTNSQTAYLGGVDLYQTTDGGNTWSFAPGFSPSLTHTDQHALAFLSNTSSLFYLGNDGGIWEGGSGSIYTDLNGANGAGLNITQLYGASVGLTGPDAQIYAGAQDNSILQYPLGVNGIAQWNGVATGSTNGDGGQVAVDPTNNAIVYAEQSWGELYRSPDGGSANSWIQIGGDATSSSPGVNGLNACPNNSQGIITSSDCDPTNWVMPIALAPTNHDELFAGTDKLYRSTNDGQSWSSLGSLDQQDGQSPISALAVGPQSDSVLYVGTNNGDVFASTDGGSTWTNMNIRQYNTADGMVTGLAIDPINTSIVYATIANFAKCSPGVQACGQHIFRSINGGATWTDIAPQSVLPNIPFESVVVDPLDDSTLFVGTDAGIFDTPDALDTSPNGPSWYQVVGLPKVAVEQLFTDSKGTQLYVATHGRGLWRVPLLDGTLYAAQSANDPTPQTGCTTDKDNALYIYADSALDGSRLWTFRDGDLPPGTCTQVQGLLLNNGTLYFAGGTLISGASSDIIALDALSGRVIWQTALPSWETMATGNGVVYVGSGSNLVALNANSGTTNWSVQLAKATKKTAAPSPLDVLASTSLLYVRGSDGLLYALNPSTGAKVWLSQNMGYMASPALANGIVYASRGANYTATFLDALNANTGALIWEQQYQVAGQAMAPTAMTIVNGILYGGASVNLGSVSDNAMLAINAMTGALKWSYYIGEGYGGPVAPQVGADGLVYDDGHDLYAWDAGTGALVWSKTFDPLPEPNQVVLSGDVLYTNPNSYAPYALNPLTGATLWSEPTYGATTPYVWPVIATTS